MAVCKSYGLVSKAASKKEMEEWLCAFLLISITFVGCIGASVQDWSGVETGLHRALASYVRRRASLNEGARRG